MKLRSLIVLFVIALLVGVIVKVPVALFVKEGRLGNAMVYGLEGTIWSGRATLVRIDQHDIASPSWDVKPWYLLLGQLKAAVDFAYLDGRGAGDVSISLGQTVNLSDFEYQVAADQFTQRFASGFVGLEGDVTLQIDNVDYQIGEPFAEAASGYLGWSKSGVAYPVSGAFGNISAVISQDEASGLLQAQLSNKGGEVSLGGTGSLGANLDYTVDVTIKPNDSLSDTLRTTIETAIPAQPNGQYVFNQRGNLNQISR